MSTFKLRKQIVTRTDLDRDEEFQRILKVNEEK